MTLPRLRAIVCITLVALLGVHEILFPVRVAAITDVSRFMRQEAWAIDDECQATGASAVTLAGEGNIEKILNFFMRAGLNLPQAAGIVGNMIQEAPSGTKDEKTGLVQPIANIEQGGRQIPPEENYRMIDGVGFGLVQWTFTERQAPLQAHVDGMGLKNTDLPAQLSFVWKELETDYLSTLNDLRRTNDPVQAAVVFHDGYENSADPPSKVLTVRGGNAKKIFDTYKNSPPLAGSEAEDDMNDPTGEAEVDEHGRAEVENVANIQEESSSGGSDGCTSAGFAGGDFFETLRAYAWADYRTDNQLEMKPDYAAAVKEADSKGLYVGGEMYDGIDCGAFVTLLVRNSGYDERYNYNGDGGYTVIQEEWLRANWEPIPEADITPAKLQPGDVAINSGHTFIYVAKGTENPEGFNAPIASASLDDRAPMADNQQSVTQSGYNWYRKASSSQRSSDEIRT